MVGSPCCLRDYQESSPTPQYKSIDSLALSVLYSPILTSIHATAAATLLQSCWTLCDSMDGSPPGSSVAGILQARVLEWGAIAGRSNLKEISPEYSLEGLILKLKLQYFGHLM